MQGQGTDNLGLFQSPVRGELDSLERRLELILHSDIPVIEEICAYINGSQGKRVRSSVLFLAAKSMGGKDEEIVTAGTAVELIHTATLIHDDIIDNWIV